MFLTQGFRGVYSLFILCLKFIFRKCVTFVVGCSFIKTGSLTGMEKYLMGQMGSIFNSIFDKLKEVKYLTEITDFKDLMM